MYLSNHNYDLVSPEDSVPLPGCVLDAMAAHTLSLTVVDVYDTAAGIGKEFESIIDNYGPETVTELMPKVINILEHLEILCMKNQKENQEVSDLRFTIDRLRAEKKAKAEERNKFETEVEQIEESWRKESRDLVETVARLQEANRKLRSAFEEQKGHTMQLQREGEEEYSMTLMMKETIDKQHHELRCIHKELSHKTNDTDALQSQVERLTKLNADYRRKSTVSQRQARGLLEEKVDLQAQLHDKEHQIYRIKDRIRHDSLESPTSPVDMVDFSKVEERLSLEGKMVVDLKDPDRPRFTLNELRDVLQERNELKTRVIEMEEELQQYKLQPDEGADGGGEEDDDGAESPLPVQGPINREPDEKLYPDRFNGESGIRKLFQRFLEKLPIEPSNIPL